jgi:hypothetical protein
MAGPEPPAAAVAEAVAEPDRKAQWLDAAVPIPAVYHWFVNHKISGPVLIGVFVVLKAYVLARGDLPTALGILQNVGLTTVVVGALLTSPATPHAKAPAPVVGYVLNDVAGGWITILVSGTHNLRLAGPGVRSRASPKGYGCLCTRNRCFRALIVHI